MYASIVIFGNKKVGFSVRDYGVIAGKLATFFDANDLPPYQYDDTNNNVTYKDYHFYDNCPLKLKTSLGFVLFSILCSINYATEFVDKYFTEEIPQKFKFAYLQYYYLCDFIKELNAHEVTQFCLDDSLQNRDFRNCLAHYGLGQFMDEGDIVEEDALKGLTGKAFHMDYLSAKRLLYKYLNEVGRQIERVIFGG